MKKILISIFIFLSLFSIKDVYGYNDYDSCSKYYNNNNNSFCYNKYKGTNYNNNCSIYNNCNSSYYGIITDYNSCRKYYNYNNDNYCYNTYYKNSNSSFYDYDSCRSYYNYGNDTFCYSYYYRGTNPNIKPNYYYDYNSCRKYYNYNNDSYCSDYYNRDSKSRYYYDYNSCNKYYNYNNNTFCRNTYGTYYNEYINYNGSYYNNNIRTGEENYLNIIYSNGIDLQNPNIPKPDYFTQNILGNTIAFDKLNNANMIDFNLTWQQNIDKWNASKNFVDQLRDAIKTKYADGTISYNKMGDTQNDFSYYVYYLNLYFEDLRNVERGKSAAFYKKDSTEQLTKTKTYFDKLKYTLKLNY